jgi:hypothetical protein
VPIRVPETDEALLDYVPGSSDVCARRGATNYIAYVPGGYLNNPLERAVAELVAANLHVPAAPTARPTTTPFVAPGTLTTEDDGRTIDVRKGSMVLVHLERGTSNGYGSPNSSDETILATVRSSHDAAWNADGEFIALKSGTATVRAVERGCPPPPTGTVAAPACPVAATSWTVEFHVVPPGAEPRS